MTKDFASGFGLAKTRRAPFCGAGTRSFSGHLSREGCLNLLRKKFCPPTTRRKRLARGVGAQGSTSV